MLRQLIVLLFAIGVVVGDYNECFLREITECRSYPRRVPTTTEGLKRDCNNVREGLECAKNIHQSCPENENQTKIFERISNILKDVCDEDSNTHEVLSRHISCAGPIFEDKVSLCSGPPIIQEEMKLLEPLLTDDNRDLLNCGVQARQMTCSSIIISKICGAELKDILMDLQKKYNEFYVKECTSDKLERLQSYLDSYKNLLMQQEF